MISDSYADTPTIASDPIYVGPPDTLELDEDVGTVRVWSDDKGEWVDDAWEREDGVLTIFGGGAIGGVTGTVRVVEMRPVADLEPEGIGEYGPGGE